MKIVIAAAAAVTLVAGSGSGSGPATAAKPLVLEAQCLCKLGHKPHWYKAHVALTPESRDKLKAVIEAGGVGLWKTVTLKGAGCNPATFPAGFKEKCGDTSIFHKAADGKETWKSVPNEEFSGAVTIEVQANGGIPTAPATPGKEVTIDEKRWPETPNFSVMGTDVNAPKPAKKKKGKS
ncbi:MAG: hypothetical protein KDJ37_04825 [Hyphomicrobiaceae bacterium]|nr:hypothetical protein [Hyphomicrobiaceae bacterium]